MSRTSPIPLRCWDLEDNGGLTIIDGKPNWPDVVQVTLRADSAWDVIHQLLSQLRRGEESADFSVVGKLTPLPDEENASDWAGYDANIIGLLYFPWAVTGAESAALHNLPGLTLHYLMGAFSYALGHGFNPEAWLDAHREAP